MPKTLSISFIFFLLFFTISCAAKEVDESKPLQQQQTNFLEALSGQDLDRVMEFFAGEAVVHITNMPPVEGRENIRGLYENVFRFLLSSEYAPGKINTSESADMAYSTGSVTTSFPGEQGTTEYPGKYLLVWEKLDGEWQIVVYSISNNRAEESS